MHVVEVGGNVALAHVKVDAVGKILGEIVDRPVQAVLVRCVGACRVPRTAVPELAAAAIGRADTPQLRAGGFGDPGCGCSCGPARLHDDAVLCILTEDSVAIDGQAVRSGFDAGQCNGTVRADITPVLVRLRVEVVVLEVEAIAGKDGDGVGDTGRECNLTLPGTTARSLDVAWDVLSNGIVELRIPGRVRELSGISTQCLNRGSLGGFVEIVIGLSFSVSSLKISTRKVNLTGPNVRSKPPVRSGFPFPWWLETRESAYCKNLEFRKVVTYRHSCRQYRRRSDRTTSVRCKRYPWCS